MRKFNKAIFLDFREEMLEKSHWKRIDSLCNKRLILNSSEPQQGPILKEADCLIIKLGAKIPKEMMDEMPKLKYLGMNGTGYGGIDVAYAAKKDIAVTNIAGYSTEAVAEFTFALIINHLRKLHTARNKAKEGGIDETGLEGTEISGKKFGVIGAGRIGNRVAELALAFGADVSYFDKERKPLLENKGSKRADLSSLMKENSIVTIHLPLSKETEGIINRKMLDNAQKGAIIVNVAPNEIVDLNALEIKLKNNELTYIFDHPDEMPREKYIALEKAGAITYPPIGYMTVEAMAAKKEMLISNMENFLMGKPSNKVN